MIEIVPLRHRHTPLPQLRHLGVDWHARFLMYKLPRAFAIRTG